MRTRKHSDERARPPNSSFSQPEISDPVDARSIARRRTGRHLVRLCRLLPRPRGPRRAGPDHPLRDDGRSCCRGRCAGGVRGAWPMRGRGGRRRIRPGWWWTGIRWLLGRWISGRGRFLLACRDCCRAGRGWASLPDRAAGAWRWPMAGRSGCRWLGAICGRISRCRPRRRGVSWENTYDDERGLRGFARSGRAFLDGGFRHARVPQQPQPAPRRAGPGHPGAVLPPGGGRP